MDTKSYKSSVSRCSSTGVVVGLTDGLFVVGLELGEIVVGLFVVVLVVGRAVSSIVGGRKISSSSSVISMGPFVGLVVPIASSSNVPPSFVITITLMSFTSFLIASNTD